MVCLFYQIRAVKFSAGLIFIVIIDFENQKYLN